MPGVYDEGDDPGSETFLEQEQPADTIINAKMDQNEAKYPVEKCRGSNAKYDQL